MLNLLQINILPQNAREFSYTDKKDGYFYGNTHSDSTYAWHMGWNIGGNRILSDYEILVDKKILPRKTANVLAYPHKLKRIYANKHTETFLMLDNQEALVWQISSNKNQTIGIKLNNSLIEYISSTANYVIFKPKESPEQILILCPIQEKTVVNFHSKSTIITSASSGKGFLLTLANNLEEALAKSKYITKNLSSLLEKRKNRIADVTKSHEINSNNKSLNTALPWIGATLDQLVTQQQGKGIYAGLPWFNQYWGRDMFISMPGTCLVSGQFENAKEILLNFAKFQNLDSNHIHYGRIPNRAQPKDIIYNTTDGTPLYINQIKAYIDYSGDTSIIASLYPTIKKSLDGSLKNWVDKDGYLTHDDADTWMDAKIKGITPLSPRGNRANDIQALWFLQLQNTVFFAKYMKDYPTESICNKLIQKVKNAFKNDFVNNQNLDITDHISKENIKDSKNRPNKLYCYELLDNENLKHQITQKTWQSLVYPWGVASLSQLDDDFHPYHEHWHYYHKDEAYHNGTIWLWNNGIAMQRMIEAFQKDKAFELFKNMNQHALSTGAIGSLAENADALPLPNKNWVRNTGTFLQAWSNAEHLRVWYQYFLGFRPLLSENTILFQPNIPSEINQLTNSLKIGYGNIDFEYIRNKNKSTYTLINKGIETKIKLDISDFESTFIDLKKSQNIIINTTEKNMIVKVFENNKVIKNDYCAKDKQKSDAMKQANLIFKNVDFVKPVLKEGLKCLKKYHKIPLTF